MQILKILNSKAVTGAYLGLISISVLSKVFGFVREIVIANTFGVSQELDTFLVALTIPNLIFSVLLYAVPNIVIPQFSKEAEESPKQLAYNFSSRFFYPYSFYILLLSALYFLLVPFIIKAFIQDAKPEQLHSAIVMGRLFTFFVITSNLISAFRGYYNLNKWFIIPAIAPLVMHVFVVTLTLAFGEKVGPITIVYGMVIGSFFQLLIMLFYSSKKGILQQFKFKGVKARLKTGVIIIFAIEILGQTYTFIDRSFVSQLPQGYLSGLNYATLLYMLPITILGMTLGTVLFPNFSRDVANKKMNSLFNKFTKAAVMVILMGVSCGIVLYFGSEFIVKTLLQRGKFDAEATQITKHFLSYLAFGIPFVMLHGILVRLYLALKKQAYILAFVVVAIVLKVTLSRYFLAIEWYWGLALSTVLAFFVNDVLLVVNLLILRKKGKLIA